MDALLELNRAEEMAQKGRSAFANSEEPEPPAGYDARGGGWWPDRWAAETEDFRDSYVVALAQLVRLALSSGLDEVRAQFYVDTASRAYHNYTTVTRRHATAWVDAENSRYYSGPPDE